MNSLLVDNNNFSSEELKEWVLSKEGIAFFTMVYSLWTSNFKNSGHKEIPFEKAFIDIKQSNAHHPFLNIVSKKNMNRFFKGTIGATDKWDFFFKLGIITEDMRDSHDVKYAVESMTKRVAFFLAYASLISSTKSSASPRTPSPSSEPSSTSSERMMKQ